MSIKCPWCENEYDSSLSKCPKCGQCKIDRSIYEYGMSLGEDTISEVIRMFDAADSKENESEIKRLMKEAEKWSTEQKEWIPGEKKKILHFRDDGDLEERVIREGGFENVIKADKDKAVGFLIDAVKLGSLPALRQLLTYRAGLMKSTMNRFALLCAAAKWGRWGKRALILGLDDNLSRYSIWEKRPHAYDELKKFSDNGYAWAKCALSKMLRTKDGRVAIDYKRSAELMYTAAESRPVPSMRAKAYVAICYFDGVFGKKKDVGKALELSRSIGQGVPTINHRGEIEKSAFGLQAMDIEKELVVWMLNRTNLGTFSIRDEHLALPGCFREKRHVPWQHDVFGAHPHNSWTHSSPWTLSTGNDFYPYLKKLVMAYKKSYNCNWIQIVDKSDANRIATVTGETNNDSKKHTAGDLFLGKVGFCSAKGILMSAWLIRWNIGPVVGEGCGKYGPLYETNWGCLLTRGWGVKYTADDFIDWDFSGVGCSRGDVADLLNYIYVHVWTDRKAGVEFYDGTKAKGTIHKIFDSDGQGPKNKSTTKDKGAENDSSERRSSRKRWLFIFIGIFLGLFGLHFLYARRKGWFVFYWLLLLGNFVHVNVPTVANVVPALSKIPAFGLLAGLIFVGSIFFMKKDGDGNRM